MTPRESDPTGSFSGGGAAGLEGEASPAKDRERGASTPRTTTPDVDETERDVITSGIAQTSEVADRGAQDDAEGQGQGTPQPR
jgi:hypothetical protein